MNINKYKLLKEIKLYTSYINTGDKSWRNYQAIANAYLYLDNINDYLKNTNKAIELLFEHIKTFSDDHFAKYDFLLLNCSYLWFSQNENYKLIAEKLKKHYMKDIKLGNNSDIIYYRLAQVYFMLEDYNSSANFLKFLREEYDKVSLISKAIINNDTVSLETMKLNIEKLSKKQYIGTGDSGVDIYLWYYYEVCLKYLELPNKIDDIYNFKHNMKTDKTVQNNDDIETKQWTLTLIQSTEIHSQIYISEDWKKLNYLKPTSKTSDIILETENFKNISQYIVDKKIKIDGEYWDSEEEKWKISAIVKEYSPSSDITDTDSIKMYLKDINIKEPKKSYLETNHSLNIEHKFIIKTTEDKAKELCADLSDEYFDKYFELDEIIDDIKQKIPQDIQFIKCIPYVKFNTDYITLLHIK